MFKLNVIVKLCDGETDQLILLVTRSRGSPKISQPRVHSCVFVAAETRVTATGIADTSQSTLFFILLFLFEIRYVELILRGRSGAPVHQSKSP